MYDVDEYEISVNISQVSMLGHRECIIMFDVIINRFYVTDIGISLHAGMAELIVSHKAVEK